MPFIWAGLTWLTVEILAAQYGQPRADITWQITLLQGGAVAASLMSAIALRCAGYRLYSRRGRSFQESVANS